MLRSARNYDKKIASRAATFPMSQEQITVQSQKDEADINVIMRKFGKTGLAPINTRIPIKEDFAEIFDFQSAMDAVVRAKEAFMELPAEIRSKFANNPQEYVKWCTAENEDGSLKNLKEMREH